MSLSRKVFLSIKLKNLKIIELLSDLFFFKKRGEKVKFLLLLYIFIPQNYVKN